MTMGVISDIITSPIAIVTIAIVAIGVSSESIPLLLLAVTILTMAKLATVRVVRAII